jgi:hypothetical protein
MSRLGRTPSPKLSINPAFIDAVSASPLPRYVLARQAGFPVGRELSTAFTAGSVAATPLTVARLRLLAVIVRFDPEAIFLPPLPVAVHEVGA